MSKLKYIFFVLLLSSVIFSCKKNNVTEDSYCTVRKEVYENTIDISGNIEAAEEQNITASSDGIIEKIFFKEGDVIKKGEILCSMDDIEQQYNIANMEFQIAQKKLSASPKELNLLEMQLQVQKKALENKKSIARFDGVIAKLAVSEGDYLEAKNEIATIIDRSYLKAVVEIVETDASKLKLNQKVVLTFPAYPEKVEGYVSYFPAVAKISSRGSSVIEAEIRIENPPEEILSGYSFTGTIEITAPIENLLLEKDAVGFVDDKAFVTKVDKNGKSEMIDVQVVPYGKDYVKVLSGLDEGDVVLNTNANKKSGTKKIKFNKNAANKDDKKSSGAPGIMPGGGPGMPMGGGARR